MRNGSSVSAPVSGSVLICGHDSTANSCPHLRTTTLREWPSGYRDRSGDPAASPTAAGEHRGNRRLKSAVALGDAFTYRAHTDAALAIAALCSALSTHASTKAAR